jgi:hypothetical protein
MRSFLNTAFVAAMVIAMLWWVYLLVWIALNAANDLP